MSSTIRHILFLQDRLGRHVLGGAEAHVVEMLPQLPAKGCPVELLIVAWSPGKRIDELAANLQAKGLSVSVITRKAWTTKLGKVFSSIACLASLRNFLKSSPTEALHFHLDHWFLPLILLSLPPLHVFFTFHNDEPIYKKWWFRAWYRLTMPPRYKIAAISAHVRRYCSDNLGIPLGQVALLPYGVEPLKEPPLGTRQGFKLPTNAFVVAFVGRFVPQKNLFNFCQAFKGLNGIHAALIGSGPLEPELRQFAKDQDISNVSFLGALDQARRYFHLFDLICLPSIHEGLGLVLLEAMAQGVPVCGSRAGAIPEVLRNGELGMLFSADSASSIASAIVEARERYEQLQAKAFKAQRILERDQSIESALAHYSKFYAPVCPPMAAPSRAVHC